MIEVTESQLIEFAEREGVDVEVMREAIEVVNLLRAKRDEETVILHMSRKRRLREWLEKRRAWVEWQRQQDRAASLKNRDDFLRGWLFGLALGNHEKAHLYLALLAFLNSPAPRW